MGLDPSLPTGNIVIARCGETSVEARDSIPRCRFWLAAEAERQYEGPLRFEQIDLPEHGHIAVLGALVFPGYPLVGFQILPAIGRSDIADRPPRPRNRARECQGISLASGKQERRALEIVHPCGVAATLIAQVRREQDIQAIVGQDTSLRNEPDLLQHGVTMRIGQCLLLDAITALPADVGQRERW